MVRKVAFALTALLAINASAADLPEGTKALLSLGKYDELNLKTDVYPTTDGKSYLLVYKASANPKHWIVSMPGTHGTATRELQVWYPAIKNRDIGLIVLQWWLGGGDAPEDYYAPRQSYREIDNLLRRMNLRGAKLMLHGFSRGSANIYAVKALDAPSGNHYFPIVVANSGGVSLNYPPTHAVETGTFGTAPFAGSAWITSCGMRDQNPDRDGCPAMQRTAKWIEAKGGKVVMQIEDENGGHGALNANPANAAKLLDWFLAQ